MTDAKTQIAKLPSLQVRFDDFVGHGISTDGARAMILAQQGARQTVLNFPVEVAHKLAGEAIACVPAPEDDDGGPGARAGFQAVALEVGRATDGRLVLSIYLHSSASGPLTVALDAADEAKLAASLKGEAEPSA